MKAVSTEEIRRLLTFALAGAGTVGVEMASTLAEMSRMALAHDFRHIDPRTARILLYEAAPRMLPTYPEDLSRKAHQHLESLGVEALTNDCVTGVDSDGIFVSAQKVPAGTVLWGLVWLHHRRAVRKPATPERLWSSRICPYVIIRTFLPLETPLPDKTSASASLVRGTSIGTEID